MLTIFRYSLSRYRGQIIGWGIGLFLLGWMMVSFFPVVQEQGDQLQQLVESYPPAFMAAFGIDTEDLAAFTTPAGFLSAEFFSYMPLILGIFAVLGGSGMLVADEENGRLDLIQAHPISRTELFMGRLLAFVVATVAILFIAWLGLALPELTSSAFGLGAVDLLLPFLSLLAALLLFGTLALLFSLILPSRRLAAMVVGVLLVASFFLPGFASLDERWEPMANFSPLTYYQSGDAINGLNGAWLGGLLILAALFAALAWWRFQEHEIRVAGEGGWQLPRLRRRSTT